MPGEIVILSGPPGAGKTTIARAMVEGAGRPAAHLPLDDFFGFVRCGRIEPWLAASQAQNEAVINALANAAQSFARAGYLAILEGAIGPWFLPAFRQLEGAPHYLVLRPSLPAALARAKARPAGPFASGPIAQLHGQFADLGALERHAIDTTAQSAADTLIVVRRAVADGALRLARKET